MSEEEVKGSQAGHRDNIDDMYTVYNPYHAGEMGVICLPHDDGNETFEVTSTILDLLRMRGIYQGLHHENPHENE